MDNERVFEAFKVLVDSGAWDLGVGAHIGEIDGGGIAVGRYLQESAEGRHIPRGSLRHDFLLEIGTGVGVKIGAGIVREIDGRQSSASNKCIEVEVFPQFSLCQGVQVFRPRPPPKRLTPPRRSVRALEPVSRKRIPRCSMRRCTSFNSPGSRWISSMITSVSLAVSSSANRCGRWLNAR